MVRFLVKPVCLTMAKGIERLSAREVATAKCPPGRSARFLSDGGGLYLRVSGSGSRSWIFRYMNAGKSHDMKLKLTRFRGARQAFNGGFSDAQDASALFT
jgi:hypothetical protein